MTKHFPVIIEHDSDGVFLVECPIIKGCRSYGYSIEEAMSNFKEAIQACLEEKAVSPELFTFVGLRDLEMVLP